MRKITSQFIIAALLVAAVSAAWFWAGCTLTESKWENRLGTNGFHEYYGDEN